MSGFFQRLFKIGQSEAHAVLDNMEDPIRMTEQGIRDLKNDLQASMTSLAEVKSVAIRLRKDADGSKSMAAEYERKAMLLLQKMQSGEMDQAEAERLAAEALKKKEEASQKAAQALKDWENQDSMANQLQGKIEKLKSMTTKYENDLITLKARARTAGIDQEDQSATRQGRFIQHDLYAGEDAQQGRRRRVLSSGVRRGRRYR